MTEQVIAMHQFLDDLDSPDTGARQHARERLEALGEVAVPRLLEQLNSASHRRRWESAKALVNIADPRAASAFVTALEDEEEDIRWLGAEGLIALGRDGAIPVLHALHSGGSGGAPVRLRKGAHHVFRSLAGHRPELKAALNPVIEALERTASPELVIVASEKAESALRGLPS